MDVLTNGALRVATGTNGAPKRGFLNETLECRAVIGRVAASPDGRGVHARWSCGICGVQARFPLETRMRHAEKQCDFCLATNLIELE